MTAGISETEAMRVETGLDTVAPRARLLSVSQIVRRLFRMVLLFLAARLLGVETFGNYALLLTVVEMIALISGVGYVDFLTREVAKRAGAAWPLGARITMLRLTYIAPALALAMLAMTGLRFPVPVVLNTVLLAITLLPRAAGESAQGVLKGLRRFAPLPWIELVQGAVVVVASVLLIHFGFGLRGVIVAEIASATAGAGVALISVAGSLGASVTDTPHWRDLARSTFAFNVYPFIVNVYDRVDVVLLAKLAGSLATGIYALPYRAYGTLNIIPYGVMGALLPAFSASRADQNAREACARAMKFLYLVSLLIVLATLTFAGPAVSFLLGESYAGSVQTIKILIWAGVPMFLNFALSTLLLAAHKEKVFLRTASTCTAFNIAANLVLIPRYSFLAAAAVTVATELLLVVMNFYLVRRLLGQSVFPKNGIRITIGFVVVVAVYWLLGRQISQLWAGSAACLVFAFLAWRTASGMRVVKALVSQSGAR
jgi:O-antigen/teichoic acid export membrane protein